jgi:chorismate dehydratase
LLILKKFLPLNTKIKVAVVSYLNTRPLIKGFEHGVMSDRMELLEAFPSKLANMLANDEVDMALIPVAAIPGIKNAEVVSDFCIATDGAVASVCIFSHCPIQEVEELMLDYQSRSSVALTKILLKEYWKISPKLTHASPGYENEVMGNRAALIIGDRALQQRDDFPFVYDLGSAWKSLTNLPFVFAVWVANKKIPSDFLINFNQVVQDGLNQMDEVIAQQDVPFYDIRTYYTDNIKYILNDEKRESMRLFLEKINQLGV